MTGRVIVLRGDAAILPLPDASVDSIVCDPPYGLEFMGRDWDAPWRSGINADAGFSQVGMSDGHRLPRPSFTGSTNPQCLNCGGRQRGRRDGTAIWKTCTCAEPQFPNVRATEMRAFQDWCEVWAVECLRVLKPGGHLLAFGGTRTWHRLTCAVEDAGFEIRESVADLTGIDGPALVWMQGSGFPKNLDVSKAIDKAAGVEREVIAEGKPVKRMIPGADQNRTGSWIKDNGREFVPSRTSAATEEAARWEGWGTALKPSWEPVVVGRKPLAGTVAQNVVAHGTGALNIDGCRVDGGLRPARSNESSASGLTGTGGASTYGSFAVRGSVATGQTSEGRWPPNVLLGEQAAADLDQQSGILISGANPTRRGSDKFRDAYGEFAGQRDCVAHRGTDSGGASRFFPVFRYEAKADASERPRLPDGTAWPTVKPVALMQWLIRLVTPPGGIVLDPFCGTGTTGQAALIEGFNAVLVDKDPQAIELTRVRLAKPVQPLMFAAQDHPGPVVVVPASAAPVDVQGDLFGEAS